MAHPVGKVSSGTLRTSVRKMTQKAAEDPVETKDAQDPGLTGYFWMPNLGFRGCY